LNEAEIGDGFIFTITVNKKKSNHSDIRCEKFRKQNGRGKMNTNSPGVLLKKGESEIMEFKEGFDKEAIETAFAFANTKGGTILIGDSDNGKVKG
jgi:hypothetical protein